jgi:reverse gyrase
MELKAVYKNLCPNCGNSITSERLEKGLSCEVCLPNENEKLKFGPLLKIEERNKRVEEIESLFKRVIKASMWTLQRFWVRRFLENESFALIAPTGSGKTTIQMILCLYAARFLRKRCLVILPTSLLASEVSERMKKFAEELNINVVIASYHSMLSNKEKKGELEKMNVADIIITTHLSVMKREEINKQEIDVIFVDDVESFLRRSKAIRYVLKMVKLPKRIKDIIDEVFEKKIDLKTALSKISKLKEEVEIKSQLIVSGATQKAKRTKSISILNSIFGFSIGLKPEFGRNILDCFTINKNVKEEVLNLVKKFGGGCLIFVPMDKGSEFAEELEKFLIENGIKVKAFLKSDKKAFEDFKIGNLDALIGMVTTRSPLVRGIDLPAIIRYAIFAGVPKFVVRIRIEEFHPTKWLMLLNNIQQTIKEEYKKDYEHLVANLIKIKTLKTEDLEEMRKALIENRTLEGFLEFVRKVAASGIEFFKKILKDESVIKAIKESPTISFREKEGEYTFLIPDAVAYIQASGRTSRLYVGGITKGLSVVIIDEEKAFNSLKKELTYFEDIEWKNIDEIDTKKVIEEIDEDRRKVSLAMKGELKSEETKITLKTRLFIVESPTKVKTIARFFGKPSKKKYQELEVNEVFGANSLLIIAASKGHITDLSLKEGLFGVEVKETFIPYFKPIKRCAVCGREVEKEEEVCVCGNRKFVDAKPRIEALRKLASLVDEVIIGTDPDGEGEKIAYDLYLLLRPLNKNIKRARFHEVTKKEIQRVMENLEDFDLNLVKAQIVRRVEDRWIGFGISPVLWKVFRNNRLSAGRVQTPVLGWIVERTKKLKEREELIILKLENGLELSFRAKSGTYKKIVENGFVEIKDIKIYEDELNPYPPFTTDTLISALTSILKVDANEAMQIAQKLFENGLITYHRTSSTTVSSVGISIAKEYISSTFGEKFFKGRKWESEGAHECIRPTKPIDSQKLKNLIGLKILRFPSPLTQKDIIAYDIIFKRFIASQMKGTKVEKIKFKVIFNEEEREFEFINKVIEDGFNKIFKIEEKLIPKLQESKVRVIESYKKVVPAFYPYDYSEIVRMMKEKGIGRPSTYAKILETLKKRGYVKEIKKYLLVSSRLGIKVFKFTQENFKKYLNEETTRKLEEEMDNIENGKKNFEEVLRNIHLEVIEIINNSIKSGVEYPTLSLEKNKTQTNKLS